jgi:hypothetical protein
MLCHINQTQVLIHTDTESPSEGQAELLGDRDIAPMEIEGQELNHGEIKATPDNESTI